MKKIVFTLIILALGTLAWVKLKDNTPANPNIRKYVSSSLGISFSYPKILAASSTVDEIILHHEVPFTHHDYCDFKGEGDTTIATLTDFHVGFRVIEKNIVDTMKQESPYIPEENFVNGTVVPSPGFIDPYQKNSLSGFSIFEGAEGCGRTVYYIELESSKTLMIQRQWITVFSGVIDVENKAAAEAVPGVINKQKEEEIFDSIMQSLLAQ